MGTIDLITPPTGAPISTGDYNRQNALIQQLLLQYNLKTLFLTNWGNTAKPQISQGVSIHHGGAQFVVNTSNYDISGAPADGRVYVQLTRVGDQLQASFISDASGFVWYYNYNGFYDTIGNQLLPYVLILTDTSTNWYKYTLDTSQDKYDILAKIRVDYNINLGSWNMELIGQKQYDLPIQFRTVYPSITPGTFMSYIQDIQIYIRNDSDITTLIYEISGSGDDRDGYYFYSTQFPGKLNIVRNAGGSFDLSSYSNTIVNRGDLHLRYLI